MPGAVPSRGALLLATLVRSKASLPQNLIELDTKYNQIFLGCVSRSPRHLCHFPTFILYLIVLSARTGQKY